MTYHAEIIAVGTELLLGNIANTDAQELSQALASVGVDVLYHTVVGDNPQRLEEAVAIARKRADLLIFTGGLGPTYDDLTKETVCRVLDVPLTFHPEAAADIRRNFDTIFHREMPPGTLRQAELPEGCEVFCNRAGTAPGCVFRTGDVTAVLLPGVPSECRYLTETALLPWLRRQSSGTILSHDLRIFGLSEPQVQELLGDLMDQAVNPSLAPYAKTGEVMLRLTAKGGSDDDCQERMAPLFRDVRSRLGDYLYGVDVSSLEEVVLTRLRQQGLYCGGVSVSLRNAQFRTVSRQMRLRAPTHLMKDIWQAAMELTRRLWKAPEPVRMLTVTALYITDSADSFQQLDLLEAPVVTQQQEKQEKLERTMDAIRGKYGRGSISFGLPGEERAGWDD